MMMHKLTAASTIKKTKIKELRDFIYENYYIQIGFTKENSCYSVKYQNKELLLFATKLIEKVPDPSKTKGKKTKNLVKKKQKIIAHYSKPIEIRKQLLT